MFAITSTTGAKIDLSANRFHSLLSDFAIICEPIRTLRRGKRFQGIPKSFFRYSGAGRRIVAPGWSRCFCVSAVGLSPLVDHRTAGMRARPAQLALVWASCCRFVGLTALIVLPSGSVSQHCFSVMVPFSVFHTLLPGQCAHNHPDGSLMGNLLRVAPAGLAVVIHQSLAPIGLGSLIDIVCAAKILAVRGRECTVMFIPPWHFSMGRCA